MSLARLYLAITVAVVAFGAMCFTVGRWSVTTDRPDCPTEDSCTVDYRNGSWVVSEATP